MSLKGGDITTHFRSLGGIIIKMIFNGYVIVIEQKQRVGKREDCFKLGLQN